jgi:hypothetical protein
MNAITELVINDKTASHTLTAADAGDYVVMNSASSTTITVNTGIFTTGQIVRIINKGAGTCTVTAGTATVSTTGSLALAQNATGTLIALSASAFIFEAGGITGASLAYDTATVATSQSTSSTSFTDLATVGPSVTLTTSTKVLVIVNCWFDSLATNEHQYADFAISGATTRSASFTTCLTARGQSGGMFRLRASAANLVTCTAGSNTFTMKYAVGGSSCAFQDRTIIVVSLGS